MNEDFKLQDVIDIPQFQQLQDKLNEIYSFPSAIIDNEGNVLTATAWQDVCTKFHRVHPECLVECLKSDQYILSHIHEARPAVTYRCPHGLVDNATPIVIAGRHVANYFTGQFFLEPPDLDFFRKQAMKYGFDEEAYLAAVRKVPVWPQKKLDQYLDFIKGFVEVLASIGHKNLQERAARVSQEAALKALRDSQERDSAILRSAMDGFWLVDLEGRLLEVNDAYCRMSGYSRAELLAMRVSDLEAAELSTETAEHIRMVTARGEDRFETRHRRKDGSVFDVDVSAQRNDIEGGRIVAFLHDITKRKEAEEGRRLNESRLAEAQAVAHIGNWETNLFDLKVTWSEEIFRIFEIDSNSFSPTHPDFLTFVHPEDRAKVDAAFVGSIDGKDLLNPIEHRIVTPGGVVKFVEERWRIYRDDQGRPVRAAGTCQDITERKRAEEVLRASEARYHALFEQAGDYILVLELPPDGPPIIRDANSAALEMHGYSRDELIGQSIMKLDVEDGSSGIIAERLRLAGDPKGTHFEVTHRRKDGSLLTAEASVRTTVIDSKRYAISVERDITARRRAEEVLARLSRQHELILRSAAEGILGLDLHGNHTFVNPAAARMLGYEIEELIGRPSHSLWHHTKADGSPYPKEECQIYAAYRDGKVHLASVDNFWRKDGTRFAVEYASTPIFEQGRLNGAVLTFSDITERKQAEVALLSMQKLESLGTLAGGIAHDFNNILTTILGNLSLLESQRKLGGEALELVKEAQAACGTAKGLSHQLLTFAKGGSPVVQVLDLRPLLKQTAGFSARGSKARCVFDLGDSPLAVNADKEQIAQVIQNLVINAAQAMPEGGDIAVRAAAVTLSEGEHPPLAAGRYIRVAVKDQGVGILPAQLLRVFDPYFSTKAEGRGLGLAVCYSIMAKHGGHISVESHPGQGAVFTLYFPAANAADIAPEGGRPALAAGKGRVLIMDDEAPVAKVLKRMLEHLGYQAESVGDGLAALDAYEKAMREGKPYDVVIMDLTIPGGLGGKETIGKLTALDPKAKAIVSSGYSNDPVISGHASHGFSGVLNKPYLMEEVSETLLRILSLRES